MRLTVLLLITVMMLGLGAGQEFNASEINEGNLDQIKNDINSMSIPEFLAPVVGDQRINLEMSLEEEKKKIAAEMQGLKVKQIEMGELENATLEATVKQEAVENITSSSKPVKTLEKELNSDRINYNSIL